MRPIHCSVILALSLLASGSYAEQAETALPDADLARLATFSSPDKEPRSLAYPIRYVLAYQTIGLGILTSLDEDITDFDAFSFDNFVDGFQTAPVDDGDSALFNWILHPLWGSETYLRARSQYFNPLESFLFSTASSVFWEYGMENFVTPPSRQDLLITSTLGSVVGELRYRLKLKLIQKEDPLSRALRIGIDPLQSLTEVIGGTLGHDWREPAYTRDTHQASTASLDIVPTLTNQGKVGWALRYETSF